MAPDRLDDLTVFDDIALVDGKVEIPGGGVDRTSAHIPGVDSVSGIGDYLLRVEVPAAIKVLDIREVGANLGLTPGQRGGHAHPPAIQLIDEITLEDAPVDEEVLLVGVPHHLYWRSQALGDGPSS